MGNILGQKDCHTDGSSYSNLVILAKALSTFEEVPCSYIAALCDPRPQGQPSTNMWCSSLEPVGARKHSSCIVHVSIQGNTYMDGEAVLRIEVSDLWGRPEGGKIVRKSGLKCLESSDHSSYDALNNHIADVDGLHGFIGWLQTDALVFFVETLERCVGIVE